MVKENLKQLHIGRRTNSYFQKPQCRMTGKRQADVANDETICRQGLGLVRPEDAHRVTVVLQCEEVFKILEVSFRSILCCF